MPSSETLRLRIELISQFEQLAERLAHGDKTAVEPSTDILVGFAEPPADPNAPTNKAGTHTPASHSSR